MSAIKCNEKQGRIIRFFGKMRPMNNRYIAKSKLHNVSFKNLNITNVNFKGSIITESSFKNSKITNCEFLGTNLSHCNFSNAIIKDSIFCGTKLKGTNFNGAIFDNVVFVTQRFNDSINMTVPSNSNKIITCVEKIELSEELKIQIDRYHDLSKDRITHLLKFSSTKYNFLHISILLNNFTQQQLDRAIQMMVIKKDFDIPTIFAFNNACKKYLKML